MNDDNDIQAAINNAGDIGCTYIPDITESEYRSMLISIDALMNRDPDPTTPDGIRLEALVRIVEQYEAKHYPIRQTDQSESYLFCDVCGRIHRDTDDFEICQCGRVAMRMEWATTEQIEQRKKAKSPTPTNPTPNHTCNDFA